ncbi:cupin domain-containing protein [Streptomyces sp. A5-4]|uniref:cupin domain-containing protein n=1 Tax=Streptomyces sp. A5-4 TaxID=3384771 RepID=UPI003DA850FA
MSGLVRKSLGSPDETRPFEEKKGKLELVNCEAGPVGRATFEAGWQWSKHVKPIAKTESCQAAHSGYVISGRMKIVMDDGGADEFGPGDVMICPPGHDAWTLGDEACVVVDWSGFSDYAKR